MYNSLLLSTGGGIISNKQQSEQDEAPVVIIGCGGTGAAALHVLKEKVHKQLVPDNPGEPVPKYDHIRFVEIDSDESWLSDTNLNRDSEFCNLKDTKIRGKFDNSNSLDNMMKDSKYQWLSRDIKIPSDLNGAGGIRQLGRYLVINEAQKLFLTIKNAINNAIVGRKADELVIHILAGISGGMGSGCFIDVCYITRKVLSDLGINGANIFGYFFLPDVITTKEAIAGITTKIDSNNRNGYAALLELDYLMQLKDNHDRFQQDYGNFSVDFDAAPVDMCHLVSAIDANGNTRRDGFDYCINVVADYIMSYLSKIPAGVGVISPKSALVNVNMDMDMLPVTCGTYSRYHVLGASNAEMPMTQIATYLATGLYGKMSEILGRQPNDTDVEAFAKNEMKLAVPELKRLISSKIVAGINPPAVPMAMVKGITQSHVHAEAILKPMNDWLFKQQGQLNKNYEGLNKELASYKVDPEATSLIALLFNKLITYAENPSYGPGYAAKLLDRNGKNLVSILQGLHVEISELAKNAKLQEDFQAEQAEKAKQAFCISRNTLLNKHAESDAYAAYLGAMSVWFQRQLDTMVYQEMDKLIQNLKSKVEVLNTNYFKKLKTVLDELQQTFAANATYFADPANLNAETADDGYTMRIMKFSDIKPHLEDVLNEEKPEFAAQAFTTYMIDHSDDWLSDDEHRIRLLVNKFISDRFKDEMNKTMEDYLKVKFPGMASQQIQQELVKLLFLPLYQKSEPLFWCSPNVSISDATANNYLSVPREAADIAAAAKDYCTNGGNTYTLRPCDIGDRIFMVRLYSGMPLYGYHGMEQIKKAYDDNLGTSGVHLYERGEINWKERLVTPTPFSINKREIVGWENIEKCLEAAEKNGILQMDEQYTECKLFESGYADDPELTSFLSEVNAIGANESEWNRNPEKISEVRSRYFTDARSGRYDQTLMSAKKREILGYLDAMKEGTGKALRVLSNGTANKKEVCEDHLVQSYKLRSTMIREVNLYQSMEQALEVMDFIDKTVDDLDKVFKNYFNALVLGMFKVGIGKLSYTYVERHRNVEAVLSSNAMPYGKYMLYQGFQSYQELDDSLKADIKRIADSKMENLEPGDDALAKKFLDTYTPEVLGRYSRETIRDLKHDDIDSFYEKLVDGLYDFTEQFNM